jgi:hypothetical protein
LGQAKYAPAATSKTTTITIIVVLALRDFRLDEALFFSMIYSVTSKILVDSLDGNYKVTL